MKYAPLLVASLLFLPLLACAGDKDKRLFEEKCSTCHKSELVEKMNLDKAGWSELVARMKKRAGNLFTEEEASRIADYLAKTHPKVK